MVTILMILAKMTDPIFFHDVTSKILSGESNYIVDVNMWPKFINSSICMREAIITLIL